jgi:hypothetical protein
MKGISQIEDQVASKLLHTEIRLRFKNLKQEQRPRVVFGFLAKQQHFLEALQIS